jgi:hypothetical protein
MDMITTPIAPEGFAEFAATENDAQLGKRFDMSRRQAATMRNKLSIPAAQPRRNGLPIPDDFASVGGIMTKADLCKRYSVGEKTIERWRRECNIVYRAPTGRNSGTPYKSVMQTSIAPGRASAAAQHLRIKGFRPVYNRVIESPKLKDQFVVGTSIMTADEMIELAVQKGFTTNTIYF